jgi:hypothetical protein
VDADAPRTWTDLLRDAAITALVAWTTRLVLAGMSAPAWSARVLGRLWERGRATVGAPPLLSSGASKRKKRHAAAANATPTAPLPVPRLTSVERGTDPSSPVREGTVDTGTDPVRRCTVSQATQTTAPNAEALLARATERIERACRRTTPREDGRYGHGQEAVSTAPYVGQMMGAFPTHVPAQWPQYDVPAFYGWMPQNWYG